MDALQDIGGSTSDPNGSFPEPIRITSIYDVMQHIEATLAIAQAAKERQRPMTERDIRRHFERRWTAATWPVDTDPPNAWFVGLQYGRSALARRNRS